MLYYTTTYYKTQDATEILQIIRKRYAGGHGQAPGREHVGGEKRRRKPVEAFSGVGRPFPRPRPVSFALGAPGQLGAWPLPWGPASSFLAVGDPRLAAVIVGSGEAGQLAGLVGVARPPFPLGVQPAAVPASAGGRGRARRWQTAFPAKPAFLGPFELSRCLMRAGRWS